MGVPRVLVISHRGQQPPLPAAIISDSTPVAESRSSGDWPKRWYGLERAVVPATGLPSQA